VKVELLFTQDLKPHEEVRPERLAQTVERLRSAKKFSDPIWVDEATNVILDGHHRWCAFLHLGYKCIPCVLLDYFSESIVLQPRGEFEVSKREVIERAHAGRLFPPKSTRHLMPFFPDMPRFELPSLNRIPPSTG